MNRAAATSITSDTQPQRFPSYSDDRGDPAETTIRPRNRKLASGGQELVSTTATSTPGGSRAVSPIPPKHPSRSTTASAARSNGRPVGGLLPAESNAGGRSSPQGFGGIWEGGWTALQGLASSVLGVDTENDSAERVNGGSLARRTKKSDGGRRKIPETWGPAGLPKKPEDVIGAGSVAERGAAVRALKMKGVLEGREEDLNVRRDTNGNYKRRTSLDDTAQGGLRDGEGDALVYIHHVQPQDTLAGVVLRYNCQPAVFRKANRLWPNDSIQIRKIVVLPVDACTIKGRPCEPPSPGHRGVDLLAPTPEFEDPFSFNNGTAWPGPNPLQSAASAEQPETGEHPWSHVRWVLLDSSPSAKPVEIARMPRQTLGYFPPRRRKSQATISTVSSPRGSSDFPPFSFPSNPPSGSPSSTVSRRASNLGHRPSPSMGGGYAPPSAPATRTRGQSVGEVAERMGWMRGPGGVGTLSKNVRKPGPAQDGLNSWAKKHIPGLAIDSLPSVSLVGGESAHFGFNDEMVGVEEGPMRALRSGTATPSGAGQGLGLENAAAAIEGWVRRLAAIRPGTPRLGGSAESSDLIELLDGAGSDDGRGFELNPGTLRVPTPGLSTSGREDLDGLIRGRATSGAKGGKGD
jgi:hypothetical protein